MDIDEFKKTMKEIVDRIQSQSKLVEEITGGRVTIRTYIGNETSRYTKIYSDIILKDLSMEVYQGDSKIHTQPLEIIIDFIFSIRLDHQPNNWTYIFHKVVFFFN